MQIYYWITIILFITFLYHLFSKYNTEHFTWTHPCKHKCKQKATIDKYNCSKLNAEHIASCICNVHQNEMNCKYACNQY